jgi:hypothetical protein
MSCMHSHGPITTPSVALKPHLAQRIMAVATSLGFMVLGGSEPK